jgi:zinc protease
VGVALSEAVAQGDWRLYFLLRDRVKAMTLADVQRVASQYLVQANRTLGRYEPTAAPVRAPAPAMADVAQQMQAFKPQAAAEAGESFVATPDNINARTQRITLPSGLKLALLPKATRGQAVKLTLALRHGDEQSLKGWGEAPSALAALLDKGTPRLSRQQVQDRLDALQSDLSIGQAPGVIQVQLNSKRAQLPQAIELLGELLREASLPADVLEEVRRQALSALESQRKEPEAVLANAIGRHANPYPRGDVRHARTFDEIEADWKGVSLDQVRSYRDRFLGASHADMAVVGDFDTVAVQAAVRKAFDGWASPSAFQRVPEPWVAPQPTRMMLATPDKQNAAMSVALPLAVSDRHPDYAALMLANHLFGAGGDSRLWNRIREKEGLSYNVYSAVQWNQIENNSEWNAEAIFAPQNRAKVEKAFREELSRSLQDGFTAQELEAGKRSLLNFRQLSRAQDARIAAAWVQNLFLGRTFADSARVDRELQALTLQQVNEAWRRHIKAQDLVLGFAGDFKNETAAKP